MAPSSVLPFSPAELAYLHTSLSSIPPIRPDSRSPTDFRPFSAETGILPATNGSAHASFSDGSEAIVGVKLEVEKTVNDRGLRSLETADNDYMDVDVKMGAESSVGRPEWISLTLTLPGMRDDDANLVFLEEMLREALIFAEPDFQNESVSAVKTLQDRLVINSKWHWHVYIDVLLISSHGLASYPLPLLSMATHLALRDTRIPRLKSEGEEDPIADDDWMASVYLFPQESTAKPPVTLLVIVIGDSVIFDPTREELSVADGVIAVSVGVVKDGYKLLAMRMIDTPARDTMKGIPSNGDLQPGPDIPGVWKPRVGGIKRAVVKNVVKTVLGGGVARDVMDGLDAFLIAERATAASATVE